MKRLLLQIFAWLAILVGAGLMLQPTVSQYLTRRKSTAAVETFVQSAAESAAVAADDHTAENTRPYADLYDALQAYNAEIYAAGQSGLKDPFAYETPAFDLTAYGLPDDMIAALWVPRLDLGFAGVSGGQHRKHGPGRRTAGADLDAAGRREHQHGHCRPPRLLRRRDAAQRAADTDRRQNHPDHAVGDPDLPRV